ncbi:MAG: glycosyltransferase family 9 protein [Elusimicrobiota bacterium]|jgi:ADP-heptose:LPS heptosyltransferase|nr:glycosyltransferase family 9 protein [Elusimicrobiota bacterium]
MFKTSYNLNAVRELYSACANACRPDCYNLVLHKHLGDLVYQISAREYFEKKFGTPLCFIVPPKFEFLMQMFGVKDYSVVDFAPFFKQILADNDFKYMPPFRHESHPVDMFMKSYFSALPHKGIPFICDSEMTNLLLFDRYFAYLWAANLELDEDLKFPLPQNAPAMSAAAKKALGAIAPLDKIVLFAPEAATAAEFAPEFWNIIAKRVRSHGYKIIVNSKKYKIKHGISAFDLDLSLSDIVALGLSCAYMFSLRSGLCDVFAAAGEKLYAFYPAVLHRETRGLNRCFEPAPRVNEIAIWKWRIDKFAWEGEDIALPLQKYINKLRRAYIIERIKYILFLPFRDKRGKYKSCYRLLRDLAGKSKVFAENNIENKPPKRDKIIKIFGINVYSQKYRVAPESRQKTVHSCRIRILGIPVFAHYYGKYKRKQIFGIPLQIKNWKAQFFKDLFSQIDRKYDDIYISRHNIGETFVYLAHITGWFKANGSKKPLVIVWRKKDIAFYKMFLPPDAALQYLELDQNDINKFIDGEPQKIGRQRLFCPTKKIAQAIKQRFEQNPETNFYNYIVDDMKAGKNSVFNTPKYGKAAEQNLSERMKRIGLTENFVVFCPEATSLKPMPNDFWQTLADNFKSKGCEVFLNSYMEEPAIKNVKTAELNIEELFILATKAQRIITLGSGLSILLALSGRPMDIIYTDFIGKSIGYNSTLASQIYSVLHLPGVSPGLIKEYDTSKIQGQRLIDEILNRY